MTEVFPNVQSKLLVQVEAILSGSVACYLWKGLTPPGCTLCQSFVRSPLNLLFSRLSPPARSAAPHPAVLQTLAQLQPFLWTLSGASCSEEPKSRPRMWVWFHQCCVQGQSQHLELHTVTCCTWQGKADGSTEWEILPGKWWLWGGHEGPGGAQPQRELSSAAQGQPCAHGKDQTEWGEWAHLCPEDWVLAAGDLHPLLTPQKSQEGLTQTSEEGWENDSEREKWVTWPQTPRTLFITLLKDGKEIFIVSVKSIYTERSLESERPFDPAKQSLTRRLENECGETQPWNSAAFPSRKSPSRTGGGLASRLCIMRFGILKEKDSHPISVRSSPCSCSSQDCWVAHAAVKASATVPQHHLFSAAFWAELPACPPQGKEQRAGELSQAQRDQDIWPLPSGLYWMFLNFNWASILGI